MKKLLLFCIAVFLLQSCNVQRSTKTVDNSLFRISNQAISKEEFKYAFLKNYKPSDTISLTDEVNNYLDLYVKFKLKVKEARSREYHKRDSYIKELKSYQKDLAKPYLTENKVTDQLIQEAHNRMTEEVKASHILISVNNDSLGAKKKITEIKAWAEKGLSFDSLASIYSNDPSAKNNGGNLGYFSAMQMVYPFETAAYNTSIGSISDIVTTRFGYHILKVFDRRPAQGQVKVAHIMLRAASSNDPNHKPSPEESKKLEKKIQAIYQEAIAGKDWQVLAKDYSQDARSKNQGGELPWLSTGNFIPSFEKVAFGLSEKGQISKPFQTVYGWHIMKLIDKKGVGSLAEMKEEISKRIQRDSRSEIKNKQVLLKLKQENKFQANDVNISEVISFLDKKDTASIDINKPLFSLLGATTTNSDFLGFLNTEHNKDLDNRSKYNQFEEKSILKFETDQLEVKYPEYAHLLNEYRDGILLFDIMEREVWGKASQDTLGLNQFYNSKKNDYTKYNVKRVVIYTSKKQLVIDTVKINIQNGLERRDIMDRVNEKEPLLLQSNIGLYEKGEHDIVDLAKENKLFEYHQNDKYYLVHTIESFDKLIPQLKDIKGKLISDYQDQLESDWIKELKAKYPVTINNKSIKEVIDEINEK